MHSTDDFPFSTYSSFYGSLANLVSRVDRICLLEAKGTRYMNLFTISMGQSILIG